MNVDRQSVEDGVREAEARALDYEPVQRAKTVRENISIIERMKAAGASEEDIEKEVDSFKNQFPFLYKMVIKPNYDKATLKTMLVMLDKIGDKSMSQHQASVLVGGRLVDKYVKPDLL
jgi:hypothetical protein